MRFKTILLTLAATSFLLAGCSSDSDDAKKNNSDAKKAEEAATPTKSKSAKFLDAVNSKLDTTRVKSDKSDMYRFKNDETVIFHEKRRSDDLLEKNESLDSSYYK